MFLNAVQTDVNKRSFGRGLGVTAAQPLAYAG